MKTTMIAAIAITVLGLFAAQEINANVTYFYGIVTTASNNQLVKVGDAVFIKINYSSGQITRATATVNDSVLNLVRTNDGSTLSVDENPADGVVQWHVVNGLALSVDVKTSTP